MSFGTAAAEQVPEVAMKKVLLAGFWTAQYVLGAAAIYTMHEGTPLMSVPFLLASYFATIVGGKALGIRDEMQRDAHASVPAVVNMLWTLIGFIVVVVFVSTIGGIRTIGGIPIPISGTQALLIFYGCAALRDVFLARFYFAQRF